MPKQEVGSEDCVSNVNIDNCSIAVNPASIFTESDRIQTNSENPNRRYSDNHHNRHHPVHNKSRVQFARSQVESVQEIPSMFAAADRGDPCQLNRGHSAKESGDYIRIRGDDNDDDEYDSEETESDDFVLFDTQRDASHNRAVDHAIREGDATHNHAEHALGRTKSQLGSQVDLYNRRDTQGSAFNIAQRSFSGVRRSSLWDNVRFGNAEGGKKKKKKHIPNTYQLEPFEGRRFNYCMVKAIMDQVTDHALLDFPSYDAFTAGKLIKKITGGIVNRTKIREYDRLKIVCHVTLMELTGQSGMVASRHLWGDETDKVITITRSKRGDKGQFECIVTVYGMYFE